MPKIGTLIDILVQFEAGTAKRDEVPLHMPTSAARQKIMDPDFLM